MKVITGLVGASIIVGTSLFPTLCAIADEVTIYACVMPGTGQMRAVNGPGQCKNNENELSWNVAGAPGPEGAQGATGEDGKS